MSRRKVKLGDFLIRSKILVDIEDSRQYKRVTIRTKHQGVSVRDFEIGAKIGTKKQFILKAGQFVLSKIDAMYGAFGIAPDEVDGAIITGNFWAYDYDENMVSIEWLNHFTNSPDFYDLCRRASTGITHRKYLDEDFFLSYEVTLPDLDEQNNLVVTVEGIRDKIDSLENEISHQLTLLDSLNQAILQEAVQGKLVPQDPNDEPAGELLKRIKLSRVGFQPDPNEINIGLKPTASSINRAGFKPRPIKELPPIKPEEIPFEIPENWVWCRLGEICEIKGGKRVRNGYKLLRTPTEHIYIRVTDMKNGSISNNDIHYIDEKIFKAIKQYTISKNDLYITIAGTIGEVGEVPEMFDGANLTENAAKFVFNNELVNRSWLRNILSSKHSQLQFLDKTKKVTAQPKLALTRIATTLIPLPPLSEQKRIVAEIEKQFAKTKQLKELVLANQVATEQLLKALLHQAFLPAEAAAQAGEIKESDLAKA